MVSILGACGGEQSGGAPNQSTNKSAYDSAAPPPGYYPKPSAAAEEPQSHERYNKIEENPFLRVANAPLSTFSIDVDTASYSNVRRFLNDGSMPPKDAVRIEELINYFSYDYPEPVGDTPFSITTETAGCPWNAKHRLVHIGLQGKRLSMEDLPPANLVFLIDTSGSMSAPDKLPLLQQAMNVLVDQLRPTDRISIVTYAGSSTVLLDSASGDQKDRIRQAFQSLTSGGSTAGAAGIVDAYRLAQKNFVQGGANRVMLATDGDFNVGVTSQDDLVKMIEEKRQSGVFLSVCGFGTGNLNDAMMEQIADKGNGNYAYIDTIDEARKVLGRELAGTLGTIAKDVKIQIEFNPKAVAGYRLIGYENRVLDAKDFNDDKKDAGEIGAGHAVTALYEVVPAGQTVEESGSVDPLIYQQEPLEPTGRAMSGELMTVKVRYKQPDGATSKLLSVPVVDQKTPLDQASRNFKFSAAVASFGMLLRQSKYRGDATYDQVLAMANTAVGADLQGERAEFVQLVTRARALSARS